MRVSEIALKWVERGIKMGLKECSSSDEEDQDDWQKVINKKKNRK